MQIIGKISMKIFFVVILLVSFSSFAKDQVSEVRKNLHIVEGDYELVKGPKELCIEGSYELKKGIETVSLMAGGGIFAMNLDKEKIESFAEGCKNKYATTATKQGFHNLEEVHCAGTNVSYHRNLEVIFFKNHLRYTLRTSRPLDKINDKIECLLKKK